jgi:hypothetical protein
MSYWNSVTQSVVSFDPYPIDGYPGWEWRDCGCCGGIEWGGLSPEECKECMGGAVAFHKQSKRYALYPGGSFTGRRE